MALFLVITLALAAVVHAAALAANYPVNAQLPPVARVSQPFRFVFAESTFSNTDSDTRYSLKNAPSWLGIDSTSRTLSGTPDSQDSGSATFQLVASNDSGSASMDVTLVVTSDQGPVVGMSVVSQLQTVGPVSYPATLHIHPGQPFSIEFDPSTFHNTHPSTIYYGTSPNNAPLPSWIHFDPTLLKFAGNTPAWPGSGSQEFTFQLVASDVAGFNAVNQTFQLAIGPHILAFNETEQIFNLTRGETFTSPGFQSFITLDSSAISSKDLISIDAQLPDWLSLEKNSISLIGTPPKDAVNQNITITVTDSYHDETKLMVRLEFLQLFLETVQGCEATIGEDFTFVFNQSVLTDDSVQLDVDLGDDLPWLSYNSVNKTLFGHVPSDLKPQTFTIHLKASSGSTENRRDFDIDLIQPSHIGGSDPGTSSPSNQKAGIIAISVIIPTAVILSSIILFACWRRRRKTATVEDGKELPETKVPPPRPARPDLPNCQPGAAGRPSQDDKSDDWTSPITPTSDLPKLELGPDWNVTSFAKPGETMMTIPEPSPPPRSPKRSAFVPLRDPVIEEENSINQSPTRKQNQRMSISASPGVRRRTSNRSRREPLKTIQPRAMKRESIQSSRSKRYSKRSSGISTVASGLPVRMSGAGHGAGGFGPPGHGFVRMSWQNTQASFMSDDGSVGKIAPLFPRPPAAGRARYSIAESIPENSKRVTLRAVEPDGSTSSEADSLEAFVHSRAKHRNSSNPLFSAQISHRTSSGLRALERARSLRSRADTVSVSTFSDEYRQSIQGRPHSTTMSVSEYGDENRASQYQPLQPPRGLFPLAEGGGESKSQLSLAHDYRGVISPLPRFWSENSLSSARHREPGSSPKQPQQLRTDTGSGIAPSSSIVSDLEEHLSRKVSPHKATAAEGNQSWNVGLERPPPVKSGSSRGLPVASSGELAFV